MLSLRPCSSLGLVLWPTQHSMLTGCSMKLTAELNKLSCFTVHCSYSFCTVCCCGCDGFIFLHGGVTQNYFTSPTPSTLNSSNIVLFTSLLRHDSWSVFPPTGLILDLRTGRNKGMLKNKVKMLLFYCKG